MAKNTPVNLAPKIKVKHYSHQHDIVSFLLDSDTDREVPRQEYVVEVLSIHFEKNTMRVRFPEDTWGTIDLPADAFFEQMHLIAK